MQKLWKIALIAALWIAAGVAPAAAQSTTWTAEYFNNPTLTGPAVLMRIEAAPSGNWGYGSPAPGIVADNFSARWTSTAFVNAGTYRVTVRADDGFRVIINGVVVLDQFRLATGQTYTTEVYLAGGTTTFTVEYFEAFEVAFIDYRFEPVSTSPIPGGTVATVTASRLNVRSGPAPTFPAVGQISQGQTYAVVGRTADTSWVQLNVNGIIGWVNRLYVSAPDLSAVPITDGGGSVTPPPNAFVTVTPGRLNVRATPNPFTGAILTTIGQGQVYSLIGRNADSSWLQINVHGMTGWVRSTYVSSTNLSGVPITDAGTNPSQPVASFATVNTFFLNVRSGPAAGFPRLTVIARGQTYAVVGRNAAGTWVQLNVNGTLGWVNRGYVSVTSLQVPVTG